MTSGPVRWQVPEDRRVATPARHESIRHAAANGRLDVYEQLSRSQPRRGSDERHVSTHVALFLMVATSIVALLDLYLLLLNAPH